VGVVKYLVRVAYAKEQEISYFFGSYMLELMFISIADIPLCFVLKIISNDLFRQNTTTRTILSIKARLHVSFPF
jgi:hypothetical protein